MSNNPAPKIDSLTRLRIEKNRLETFCNYQEKLIGLKFDYFRLNYSEVLSESILPYDREQNLRTNNLLDAINEVIAIILPEIFRGKFLPGMLLKVVEILSIWTFRKTRD